MVEASHPEIIENNLAIPTNQKPYEIVRLFLWALEMRPMDLSKENLIEIEN